MILQLLVSIAAIAGAVIAVIPVALELSRARRLRAASELLARAGESCKDPVQLAVVRSMHAGVVAEWVAGWLVPVRRIVLPVAMMPLSIFVLVGIGMGVGEEAEVRRAGLRDAAFEYLDLDGWLFLTAFVFLPSLSIPLVIARGHVRARAKLAHDFYHGRRHSYESLAAEELPRISVRSALEAFEVFAWIVGISSSALASSFVWAVRDLSTAALGVSEQELNSLSVATLGGPLVVAWAVYRIATSGRRFALPRSHPSGAAALRS